MRFNPLFALVILVAFGAYWLTSEAGGDPTIEYARTDMSMNDAQAEAQRHIDDFLNFALDNQGIAGEGMLVKVAFPTSIPEKTEVIWVGPFGRTSDGRFEGILANAPVDIPSAGTSGNVTFDKAMIRDWMFTGRDGKLYGSYTTRAMLPDMSPDMARQLTAAFSENPLPRRW